MLDTKG